MWWRNKSQTLFWKFEIEVKQNNTLLSGNADDEENLHRSGRKFIFLNRFSGDILFSSLVSFAFFGSCFCLFACCFLKLKMYILIHIKLFGQVNNKKIFIWPISGTRLLFFWSEHISVSIVESFIQFIFIVWKVEGYRNISKLSCNPLAFVSYQALLKNKEVWC